MPDEIEIPGFPLQLVTDAHGGKHTFLRPEDYSDWLEQERQTVDTWMRGTAGIPGPWVSETTNETSRFFDGAQTRIQKVQSSIRFLDPDPARYERDATPQIDQLTKLHETSYGQGSLFATDSAEGIFLTALARETPARALGAFVAIRRKRPTGDFARGITDGALFHHGNADRAEAAGEALGELAAEWRNYLHDQATSFTEEFDATMKSHSDDLSNLRREHRAFMTELEQNQQSQGEHFHEVIKHGEDELLRLRETYKQRLGLSAPVQYWKEKADAHRLLGIGAFILVMLAGGAFGLFFLSQVGQLLRPGVDPGTAEIIVLLTLATLGVWGVRIFVRLFFSQVHLNTDARERAVMIETFLALLTSEDASKEERLLVLQTIFRPTSTGIVKDDSAPPSVASEISRMLSK